VEICRHRLQSFQTRSFATISSGKSWPIKRLWVPWHLAVAAKWPRWLTKTCAGASSAEAKTMVAWQVTGLLEQRT